MTVTAINSWQDIQDEVLSRIQSRRWKPGELIPNEADLAQEFGCARATVNRALRAIADQGLIDRRRKAGTRVALHPVRSATLKIPIIRHEIENLGQNYSHELIQSRTETPPQSVQEQMHLSGEAQLLHMLAVHKANGKPYVFEDRWINASAVKGIREIDFSVQSANEWLVQNAPFTKGDITLSATIASIKEAKTIEADVGQPLFTVDRITWNGETAITCVKLLFVPGYKMHTNI